MNPIMKCCGVYCSCLACVSLIFYSLLIVIIDSDNKYVTGEMDREEKDGKMTALLIAIIVNIGCLVVCVVGLTVGLVQERNEEKKRIQDDENDFSIPTITK